MMRKALGLGLVLVLAAMVTPASALPPYAEYTVTMQNVGIPFYDPQVSSGAILNRCVSSGFSDCLPHEGEIALSRGGLGRHARCLYSLESSLWQNSSTHTGLFFYFLDLGVANTANGRYFKLRNISPAGTSGVPDFDVIWYWKLGNCTTAAELPTKSAEESTFSQPGDEQGRVPGWVGQPEGTNCQISTITLQPLPGCPRYALITMFSGDPNSRVKLTICQTSSSTSCP